MAPPTIRRSGHSRKAQFSAFTGYLVAALGAALGAIFLLLSLWRPDSFSSLRGDATDVVAPVGRVGGAIRSDSLAIADIVAGYFHAGSQNSKLRRETAEARVKLAEANAVATENKRLKELLGLRQEQIKPVAYARLIGSTSASTRRLAYLSAGREDGVKPGMPVRGSMGLVGRVLEVGDSASRVLLITDASSMVPVRRNTDEVVAFAEGRADGSLHIRLINLGLNPLKKGDVFVTSGAGGIYRPSIAVAVVDRVVSDGAIARPLSNPATTLYVAVEPVWVPQAKAVIAMEPLEAVE